jgi:hypothetical protein
LGTLLKETMGDARLTAETLGHHRREAYEQMQRRGL